MDAALEERLVANASVATSATGDFVVFDNVGGAPALRLREPPSPSEASPEGGGAVVGDATDAVRGCAGDEDDLVRLRIANDRGRALDTAVRWGEPLQSLQRQLEEFFQVPPPMQRLLHRGIALRLDRSLSRQQPPVRRGAASVAVRLLLRVHGGRLVLLLCVLPNQRRVPLACAEGATVGAVKEQLCGEVAGLRLLDGLAPHRIALTYRGATLTDRATLGYYHIRGEATLHVQARRSFSPVLRHQHGPAAAPPPRGDPTPTTTTTTTPARAASGSRGGHRAPLQPPPQRQRQHPTRGLSAPPETGQRRGTGGAPSPGSSGRSTPVSPVSPWPAPDHHPSGRSTSRGPATGAEGRPTPPARDGRPPPASLAPPATTRTAKVSRPPPRAAGRPLRRVASAAGGARRDPVDAAVRREVLLGLSLERIERLEETVRRYQRILGRALACGSPPLPPALSDSGHA